MKVVFKGNLSENSQNRIVHRYHNAMRLYYLFAAIIVIIVGVIIIIKNGNWVVGLSICGSAGFISLLLLIFPQIILHKKDNESNFPKQITIDEKNIELDGVGDNIYRIRSVMDIKKIIETEDCYYFKFYFPYDLNFICQKDLLVEGTSEEFKVIFDGKFIKEIHKQQE